MPGAGGRKIIMRYIITGHRLSKLSNYNTNWIKNEIDQLVMFRAECVGPDGTSHQITLGYSGMASGVDLWFCEACLAEKVPYIACVPFENQGDTMSDGERTQRERLIASAKEVKSVRNSFMVEHCDVAIVVWDGNKGGTHNVLQQLVEKRKDFYWINPVKEVTWRCF